MRKKSTKKGQAPPPSDCDIRNIKKYNSKAKLCKMEQKMSSVGKLPKMSMFSLVKEARLKKQGSNTAVTEVATNSKATNQLSERIKPEQETLDKAIHSEVLTGLSETGMTAGNGQTKHTNKTKASHSQEHLPFGELGSEVIGNIGKQETHHPCNNSNKISDDNSYEMNFRLQPHCVHVLPDTNQVIVILSKQEDVAFIGKYYITVLHGSVDIHGFVLKKGHPRCAVFSPHTSSALSIQSKPHPTSSWKRDIECTLGQLYPKIFPIVKDKIEVDSCIILLESYKDSICSSFPKMPILRRLFPKTDITSLKAEINEKLCMAGVSLATRWCNILPEYTHICDILYSGMHNKENEVPILIICGGRNVGKSTLARYVINSGLNRHQEICHLECDIGQTEFTPPGCVSLTLVTKPLLGPPFTHLKTPECSYFYGSPNAADNPDHYLSCIEKTLQYYKTYHSQCPLVINTMGWIRGLGISLLIDTIRMIQPTHLVQIDHINQNKNYNQLTTEYVASTSGWRCHYKNETSGDSDLNYVHLSIDSPNSTPGKSHGSAAEHRNLAVLAYFSNLLRSGVDLMEIHCDVPYRVAWGALAVHITSEGIPKEQWLYSLNASIVALCQAEEKQIISPHDHRYFKYFKRTPVCQCIGYGFIRGIDPEKKIFYISTPVNPVILEERVNTIIKGGIVTPKQFLFDETKKSSQSVPYVDISANVCGVQPIKRRQFIARQTHEKK